MNANHSLESFYDSSWREEGLREPEFRKLLSNELMFCLQSNEIRSKNAAARERSHTPNFDPDFLEMNVGILPYVLGRIWEVSDTTDKDKLLVAFCLLKNIPGLCDFPSPQKKRWLTAQSKEIANLKAEIAKLRLRNEQLTLENEELKANKRQRS